MKWFKKKKKKEVAHPDIKQEIEIGIQGNLVVMNFGRPTSYLSFDAGTAFKIAKAIHSRAMDAKKGKPEPKVVSRDENIH